MLAKRMLSEGHACKVYCCARSDITFINLEGWTGKNSSDDIAIDDFWCHMS